MTATEELRLEFWTAMKKYFEEKGTFLEGREPWEKNYFNFNVVGSYYYVTAVVNFSKDEVRVEFCVKSNNFKNEFLKLKELYESSSYEELGPDIKWGSPRKTSAVVFLSKHFDLSERAKWPAVHAWLLENLEKFHRFFRPKVEALF